MDIIQFTSPDHDHTIVSLHDPEHTDAGGAVYLDGEWVTGGAYDDFYPGCYGIHEWGDFRSQDGLVNAMYMILTERGKSVTIVKPECHFDMDSCEHRLGPAPEPVVVEKPKSPPQTKLSKKDLKTLKNLNQALEVIDSVSMMIGDGEGLAETLERLDYEWRNEEGHEQALAALEGFLDEIDWRKWHTVVRSLKKTTQWDGR